MIDRFLLDISLSIPDPLPQSKRRIGWQWGPVRIGKEMSEKSPDMSCKTSSLSFLTFGGG